MSSARRLTYYRVARAKGGNVSATYKMVTVVGTSEKSYEDAVRSAVKDASASLRNLGWYEVQEMRGRIDGDEVKEFQVKLAVGFRVETG